MNKNPKLSSICMPPLEMMVSDPQWEIFIPWNFRIYFFEIWTNEVEIDTAILYQQGKTEKLLGKLQVRMKCNFFTFISVNL